MVNSVVWTPEEAKYLKAIFRWQETTSTLDDEKRRQQAEEAERRRQQEQQKPAGEFRVLVIGGRGTGKTAILTRFGKGTFHSDFPDPFYERGCRHPITLTVPPPTTTTTTTTTAKQQQQQDISQQQQQPQQQQTYLIDALEMPSKHLLSNPLLAQALSITEAAVLVYSVRDEASFRLAQGLAEFMREHFTPSPTSPLSSSATTTTAANSSAGAGAGAGAATAAGAAQRNLDKNRPYPLLLVGNKSDPPTLSAASDDPVAILQEERAVSWEAGAQAARGMRMPGPPSLMNPLEVGFLEVSAKSGEGVAQIFEVLGGEVLRVRRAVREGRERAERERMMMMAGEGVVVVVAGG
ncbi:hypothetical protein NEMBOFW57_004970 [Staphylotrichum longicolle]|uniref:Uncharacterized protein n=1 Tax=Staphylotrichum longicolle TaxID=669026 RepID=A0AAD4HZ71_9PEZI|nr:hypothetical protein NEMBOFW57_004970 [Staphylotrichum longicolle]